MSQEEIFRKLIKDLGQKNKEKVYEIEQELTINRPSPKQDFKRVFENLPETRNGVMTKFLENTEIIFFATEFFTFHPVRGIVSIDFKKNSQARFNVISRNPKNADFYLDWIKELKKKESIEKFKVLGIRYYSNNNEGFIRVYRTDV